MPSGRGSSGSSGSHSSGGSSGGGGFSSSSSSSYSSSSFRRVGYMGGRKVVFVGDNGTYLFGWADKIRRICFPAIFFCVFLTFIMFAFFSTTTNEIEIIKRDYDRYQQMIDNAEEYAQKGDYSYYVTGVITGIKYNYNARKYYLEYKFKYRDEVQIGQFVSEALYVSGYTYSIYTKAEAYQFSVGDEIELVVDEYPLTSMTDSINWIDYKDMPEEKDGEYVKALKSYRNYKIVIGVCVIVVAVSIILLIISRVKGQKKLQNSNDPLNKMINDTINSKEFQEGVKRNQALNETDNHQATSVAYHDSCLDCDLNEKYEKNKQEIINDIREVKKYCKYCGESTTENVRRCPSCNAKFD